MPINTPLEPAPVCSCGQLAIPDYEIEGDLTCESCRDSVSTNCSDCEERYWNNNLTYLQDSEEYLCRACYESSGAFYCDNCSEYYSEAVYCGAGLCDTCYGEHNEDNDHGDDEIPDLGNTEGQSEKAGKVITSMRRFGVELETVYNNRLAPNSFLTTYPSWGLAYDGSIRRNKDALEGRELVSPILQGKAGEEVIESVTENARKFGFFVNTSCGFHLHLEALDFKRDPKEDREVEDSDIPTHVVEYSWQHLDEPRPWRTRHINDIPTRRGVRMPYETNLIPNPEYTLIKENTGASFFRLRELWYVYVLFDDVFRAMQPPSRRHNTFCRATSSIYSLEAIAEAQNFNELELVWYRIDRRLRHERRLAEARSRKNNTKDETRYSGFNLAPILSKRGKTIEIRHHSPTLNAEKVLRWIDLHQSIFEAVATGNYSIDYLQAIQATETNILKKALTMCRLFKIKKETTEHVMARIKKFNELDESQDEEVSEAGVGSTAHGRNGTELRRARQMIQNEPLYVTGDNDYQQAYSRAHGQRLASLNNIAERVEEWHGEITSNNQN